MAYQQCGSLCVRTCKDPETSSCPSGCAEGCFCPDGLIVHDGRCIDPVACPSMFLYCTKLYVCVCVCVCMCVCAHARIYVCNSIYIPISVIIFLCNVQMYNCEVCM